MTNIPFTPAPDNGAIREGDLAAAAALIPPVQCVCEVCNGAGEVYYSRESQVQCHRCEGAGYFLREMTKREEHYYILHLLTTRYQLR